MNEKNEETTGQEKGRIRVGTHQDRPTLIGRLVHLVIIVALTAGIVGVVAALFEINLAEYLWNFGAQSPDIDTLQSAVFMIDTEDNQGTGFNIDKQGLIITSLHVVRNAKSIEVYTPKGDIYEGLVVNSSERDDLAVVRIFGRDLPVVRMADKGAGSWQRLSIISRDAESSHEIAEGIMTGPVSIKGWDYPLMSLHGKANHGCSGSPVFNRKGEVVGMVFGNLTTTGNGSYILFIPVAKIKAIFEHSSFEFSSKK